MRPLVIVRPQPAAGATAAAARDLGLSAVVMPFFEVEPVAWRAPDPAEFDALLLTSANAVRHAGSKLKAFRNLPAHCVGEATASAARGAGFTVASVGNGGVEALLDRLPEGLRLLHLCGTERRETDSRRQRIDQVPVYAARELPVPENPERLEGTVVALHSPRAAAALSRLFDEVGLRRETVAIVAISEAAAGAAGHGWERTESAPEPTDRALLALAAQLCNNPP